MAIEIGINQKILAKVTWKNNNLVPYAPRWRLDIKSETRSSWNEGQWLQATPCAVGGTQTVEIVSVGIPPDWAPAADQKIFIEFKIMIDGRGEVWKEKESFQMSGASPNKVTIISVTPGISA